MHVPSRRRSPAVPHGARQRRPWRAGGRACRDMARKGAQWASSHGYCRGVRHEGFGCGRAPRQCVGVRAAPPRRVLGGCKLRAGVLWRALWACSRRTSVEHVGIPLRDALACVSQRRRPMRRTFQRPPCPRRFPAVGPPCHLPDPPSLPALPSPALRRTSSAASGIPLRGPCRACGALTLGPAARARA